jgi:acyl-CoA thioester hydrolase
VTDSDTLRRHYRYLTSITTRWIDNDVYGHINNATYYNFFDTVVNEYLVSNAGMDFQSDDIVGYIVASSCQYLAPIAWPATIEAGMRVNRLGNSSVQYGVGVFLQGSETASAYGTFTHVFVSRSCGKSVDIPPTIRTALEKIHVITP